MQKNKRDLSCATAVSETNEPLKTQPAYRTPAAHDGQRESGWLINKENKILLSYIT